MVYHPQSQNLIAAKINRFAVIFNFLNSIVVMMDEFIRDLLVVHCMRGYSGYRKTLKNWTPENLL